MSETETRPLLAQVNDVAIDVRNEAIVQSANLYLTGRKLALVGIGMTFLGIDTLHAFAQRAIERGEIAEANAGKMVAGLQKQATDRVEAAEQMRVDLTEKATAGVLESTNGLLRWLRVPEIKVVLKDESPGVAGETPAGQDSVVE